MSKHNNKLHIQSLTGVWHASIFFYVQKYKNILMFGRRFEAIFPGIIQHFHRKGIFAIMKRLKYLCHHPKPPAADHCHLPSSTVPATDRPPTTTSIKGIFENLSNIPGNSICMPNTSKILCSRKLFP